MERCEQSLAGKWNEQQLRKADSVKKVRGQTSQYEHQYRSASPCWLGRERSNNAKIVGALPMPNSHVKKG